MCGSGATAKHGGNAGVQRVFNLLGADEVDVGIEPAGGQDAAFASDGPMLVEVDEDLTEKYLEGGEEKLEPQLSLLLDL